MRLEQQDFLGWQIVMIWIIYIQRTCYAKHLIVFIIQGIWTENDAYILILSYIYTKRSELHFSPRINAQYSVS